MPNLRSYSCPECGSFLEVDRNKDTFDCPFCGKHFDALDFHGKELFEQANKYLEGRQYELAKKKFEYLLSQDPENFDFLWDLDDVVDFLKEQYEEHGLKW